MIRQVFIRVLESYFRHRWLYLIPLAIMMVAAGIYYFTLKPTYIARGIIYVQGDSFLSTLTNIYQNTGSYWISPSQNATQEIQEMLQTSSFVRAIIQKTDLESKMNQDLDEILKMIEETRADLWVYSLGDNQLLANAAHEDPKIAYQLVSALMDTFINWQINSRQTESEVAQIFFIELVQDYEDELLNTRNEMKSYLRNHPEPIRGERPGEDLLEIDHLQNGINLAATRYANALNKLEDTQLAMAQVEANVRQTYLVIDAPTIPKKPEVSMRELALTLGVFLAVGVAVSGLAVAGGAILDRSFRFPQDVTQHLELPVLAVIPDMTPKKKKWWQKKRISRRKKKTANKSEDGFQDLENETTLDIDGIQTS